MLVTAAPLHPQLLLLIGTTVIFNSALLHIVTPTNCTTYRLWGLLETLVGPRLTPDLPSCNLNFSKKNFLRDLFLLFYVSDYVHRCLGPCALHGQERAPDRLEL